MDYIHLGRTGLTVSTMGIGCGGPSRVGQRTGKPESESVSIIRGAIEAGVNVIDTAEAYRTEGLVGEAIRPFPRDGLVLSTKKSMSGDVRPEDLRRGLEASLAALGTDYIDIYHLHAVHPERYREQADLLVPELRRLQEEGKIRFLGITEVFNADPGHAMAAQALADDVWDVMMIGFNLLNQSARDRVFVHSRQQDVGILVMFAVRLALSRQERLREVVRELADRGEIDPAEVDLEDPLGFLLRSGDAVSIPDASYRFCRDEPGTHVVLSGTGSREHLERNLESFHRSPLPDASVGRLKAMFARVDSVTAQ
jgi:aryl-alcohol dehydrogenase-like predicted oxidoreductase